MGKSLSMGGTLNVDSNLSLINQKNSQLSGIIAEPARALNSPVGPCGA